MHEVVTLGECMAVPYPEEAVPLDRASTLAIDIAGAEANLAIVLNRLGHGVQFISRVGADPFGQRKLLPSCLVSERSFYFLPGIAQVSLAPRLYC